MTIFLTSLADAAAYFHDAISPQRLGQLVEAGQLHSQQVPAAEQGGHPRRGVFHEDIALHLEKGGNLAAHDCPCWRVGVKHGQEHADGDDRVADLRRQLRESRDDVAAVRAQLAQEIADRRLDVAGRLGLRGGAEYPAREWQRRKDRPPHPHRAGQIGMFKSDFGAFILDIHGFVVLIDVAAPTGVDGSAYDAGAEFLVDGELMIKVSEKAVISPGAVFRVRENDGKGKAVPEELRRKFDSRKGVNQ